LRLKLVKIISGDLTNGYGEHELGNVGELMRKYGHSWLNTALCDQPTSVSPHVLYSLLEGGGTMPRENLDVILADLEARVKNIRDSL